MNDRNSPSRRAPLLVLALALAAASPSARGEAAGPEKRNYRNEEWGFAVTTPVRWRAHPEQSATGMHIVGFALPALWSKLENQSIENSVSVTALRLPNLRSVEDVIAADVKRTVDTTESRTPAPSTRGRAFDVVSRIEGLRYRERSVYLFSGGTGYVLTFVATEGTWERNLKPFLEFVADFQLLPGKR